MPADRAVVTLTAARTVRSAALWGIVFALYIVTSAVGYTSTYRTAAARAELARSFGTDVGINAIIGPARQLDTVAGFTEWRCIGVLSLVGAVWGLLTGTRLLRGEEDAGRWELLLAGRTTRRLAAVEALLGLAGGLAALWLLPAVGTVLIGRLNSLRFGIGNALLLATACAASAAVFLAVGTVASQLAASRRQAAGYAGTVLGLAYGLRVVADSGTGVGWLRWATPLGWTEQLQPLTDPRPLALAPVAASVVGAALLTSWLAGRRDLNASSWPSRSRSRPHTMLLNGPAGLSLRLVRPLLLGWTTALVLTGLMLGIIAKSAGQALDDSPDFRRALGRLGTEGSGARAYLGVSFLIVALLVAFAAAALAGATRTEEAGGRLDQLVVRPVSRRRWLAGRLMVAGAGLVVAALLGAIASWLGTASQRLPIGLGTLLQAGINVLPAAVFVLGVSTLALGVRPRLVAAAGYGVVAWSFLVQIIGGLVGASHWVLDTSLFVHLAPAPAVAPNWTADLVLTAIGVGLAGVGLACFQRRDLVGE
jgi:ABC-2 type transport system permease protein